MSAGDLPQLGRLALTIFLGYLGAWGAQRLRLPAAQVIGPMVAVGSFHVLGGPVETLGAPWRYAAQIVVGATLASTLTPAIVSWMFRLAGPAVLGVAALVVVGILGGWFLHLATGLPLASALFAGAPGGAVEMSLAAGDLGGDVELVAALHIVRQLTVIIVIPPLLRWVLTRKPRPTADESA